MKKIQSLARRLIVKFYRASDGTEPVNDFIERQKHTVQLAIDRQIDRINALDEEHPDLAFPYSSQIAGKLRELRCHGRTLYRILYRRSKQFVMLLHIFEKHDGLVPTPSVTGRFRPLGSKMFRDCARAFGRTGLPLVATSGQPNELRTLRSVREKCEKLDASDPASATAYEILNPTRLKIGEIERIS
jgi:phage-related protein